MIFKLQMNSPSICERPLSVIGAKNEETNMVVTTFIRELFQQRDHVLSYKQLLFSFVGMIFD